MNPTTRQKAEAVVDTLEQLGADVDEFHVSSDGSVTLVTDVEDVDPDPGDGDIDPAGIGGGTIKG